MLTLLTPSDGLVGTLLRPTFSWQTSDSPINFNLQVSLSADFSSPLINIMTNETTYILLQDRDSALTPATIYFWRVGQVLVDTPEYCSPRIMVSGLEKPIITSARNNEAIVSGESAIISWSIQNIAGVTGFVVAHGLDGQHLTSTISVPVDQLEIIINGLQNNLEHFFAVKAIGSVEFDAVTSWQASNIDVILTENDIPIVTAAGDYVIV